MAWSHTFHGGSSSKASLEKTSLKLWYWAGTMSSRGQLTSAFCASWASRCNGVSVAPMWCSAHSGRSEEHTSELQSLTNLVCRLLLEKKNTTYLIAILR